MGREFSAMEDEFELSLELSIGGCYGKSNNRENIEGEFRNQCEENPSRSEFLHGKYDVGGGEYRSEFVDMQRERARQALRRREHREAREIDGISEEFSRKNQKNISILTENKILGDDFAGKQMQTQIAGNGNGDRNESRNSSIDCGSSRTSSSIFSDYRSTSLKGGSSSETESLSNSSVANQSRCVSRSDKIEGLVVNPSSKTQTQSDHVCSGTQNGGSVQHMPRVSARGNDPNGKTITGVLYKYTKSEVCIMCACHGASFSPAEFVQHAGGADISHPLKHITILPSR